MHLHQRFHKQAGLWHRQRAVVCWHGHFRSRSDSSTEVLRNRTSASTLLEHACMCTNLLYAFSKWILVRQEVGQWVRVY